MLESGGATATLLAEMDVPERMLMEKLQALPRNEFRLRRDLHVIVNIGSLGRAAPRFTLARVAYTEVTKVWLEYDVR